MTYVVISLICSIGASINIGSLTFAAPDLAYGSDIFYYLRTDPSQNNIDVFGVIIPGAYDVGPSTDLIVKYVVFALFGCLGCVTHIYPRDMIGNFDSLTYASANVGYGANLMYTIRHNATTCESYFGWLGVGTLVCTCPYLSTSYCCKSLNRVIILL